MRKQHVPLMPIPPLHSVPETAAKNLSMPMTTTSQPLPMTYRPHTPSLAEVMLSHENGSPFDFLLDAWEREPERWDGLS